jgi:hypothetical protein
MHAASIGCNGACGINDRDKEGAYQPGMAVNFLKSCAIYGYMEILGVKSFKLLRQTAP